jgi:hypothetical protein
MLLVHLPTFTLTLLRSNIIFILALHTPVASLCTVRSNTNNSPYYFNIALTMHSVEINFQNQTYMQCNLLCIYSSTCKVDLNTMHGTRNSKTVNAQQTRNKYNFKDVGGNLVNLVVYNSSACRVTFISRALHTGHIVHLCFLYDSHNKEQTFPHIKFTHLSS